MSCMCKTSFLFAPLAVLEGSGNHEYFGSLAKLTGSPSGVTYFARDPKYS